MIDIDSESFLAVVVAGALAAFLAGLVSTRMPLPVVVLEILLGILIGPDVLGLAEPDAFRRVPVVVARDLLPVRMGRLRHHRVRRGREGSAN